MSSTDKTRDVLGFGCATIDELLFVDEWPERDRKLPIQYLETQGGGLGATALIAAARMGARCSYAGMLGFEESSKHVADILTREGIDLDLVSWHEDAGAIRSFVVVDTSHRTRNIFFKRPLLVGTPIDGPSEAEIAASRCVFVDHYGGAGTVRLCEIAHRMRVPVVADIERSNVEAFSDFFPLLTHPVLSQGFAAQLTNEESPAEMVRALWNQHREAVVVTCGEHGAFSSQDGREVLHLPAFATDAIDTTGCGDCFHGVYCATLAWGFPLGERIRWASAAASLKARIVGAQKGLPLRAEVEELLDDHR